MALSGSSIIELNAGATANNVNGGGFNPSNANFLTDLTTDSNTANTDDPIVSSASYNFVAGDVGHWVYIKSGTDWTPGWYKISAVASNKATLMAAIGEAVQSDANQMPTPRFYQNTVAGCATVGTPTNGTFGIDYSQGTAAITNGTDLACADGDAAAPTLTSASAPFGVNHVGNFIHITGGLGYTAGWYEIVSVSGTTATVDRAVGTDGAKTNGTFYVGGAMSLNSLLDDELFEISVAGMRFFFKNNGTFLTNEAVNISVAGTTAAPLVGEGYNLLRGDAPKPGSGNQPLLAPGAQVFNCGALWEWYYMNIEASSSTGFGLVSTSKIAYCKAVNDSVTANRVAITGASLSAVFGCELVCYRGRGIGANAVNIFVYGNYFHDSDIGIQSATSGSIQHIIIFNIFAGCVTTAVLDGTTGASGSHFVANNTIYGAENKLGTGITMNTGVLYMRAYNNIIYGCVTGAAHADAQASSWSFNNDYYNNTTDVSNFQKSEYDVAIDPDFTDVTQLDGTGATSATNVLTVGSGTPFGSVIDNATYVYLSAGTGTGIALNVYLITAHTDTTLTLSSNITSSGNGSAIVWQVRLGHNFLPQGAI